DPALLAQLNARPEISLAAGSPLADRYEPFLLSGAIARALGQLPAARTALGARVVHTQGAEAVDWAGAFLPPPRGNRLDVGSDLDLGAVRGFHFSEQAGRGPPPLTFRWSGPQSTIHLQAVAPWHEVVVRWNGARPPGVAPAQVQVQARASTGVRADTRWTLPAADTWQEATLVRLPESTTAADPGGVDLTVATNTFVPGGADPRVLGVRIDWVELR
ncbi:MAG TPA: hypothetical protein VKY74_09880, partial [Chloroflexia bacterium]|nr:hypothetical protein [Chloroflexia bacterium]